MKVTERGILLIGTGVFFVAAVSLFVAGRDITEDVFDSLPLLLWPPGFAVAGAIITRRFPTHSVGRLLMWAGFSAGAITIGLGLQAWVTTPADELDGWSLIVADILGWIWVAPTICLFAAIARFPDGEWATRWIGRFFWVFAVSFGALVPLGWVDPGETSFMWGVLSTVSGLAVVGIVLSLVVHLVRSVRSDPVRRRQYGWVLGGLVLAGSVWAGLGGLLGSAAGLPSRYVEWFGPISFLIFPFTLVVAITRYKLYEIDRLVSRTISYGIVIVAMVAVFVGVLLGLGLMLGGQDDLTVAIATLAAVAVSVPMARRARAWVDRRFFRSRYDSAVVVARLADDLRATADLTEVETRTTSVIDEVFAPESVGVWLVEEPS